MYVYKITNHCNGKQYVGKTTRTIEQRFKDHMSNIRSRTKLSNAVLKYGKQNFVVELIDVAESVEELNNKERYWISMLQPEYNMTEGGDGVYSSNQMRGRGNPFFGKRHTQETKNRISESKKRNPYIPTEEHRKSASAKLKGRIPNNLNKLIAANKTRAKTFYLIDPNGCSIVVTNLKQFCEERGLDQRNMSNMYAGKYKSSKGYKKDYLINNGLPEEAEKVVVND